METKEPCCEVSGGMKESVRLLPFIPSTVPSHYIIGKTKDLILFNER